MNIATEIQKIVPSNIKECDMQDDLLASVYDEGFDGLKENVKDNPEQFSYTHKELEQFMKKHLS